MERPLWPNSARNWWTRGSSPSAECWPRPRLRQDVEGIGLSGQMHGLVLLDEADHVIRPALIWCDQRSQAQVDFVNARIGKEKVLAYTANPVLTGFTLPKLLWSATMSPELRARAEDAAPEGLPPLLSHRRVRHRGLRRLWHSLSTWSTDGGPTR